MEVNVFPVAVGTADPQPGVEGLDGHWLTGDWVYHVSGTHVGDAGGASVGVEDVDARINHVARRRTGL